MNPIHFQNAVSSNFTELSKRRNMKWSRESDDVVLNVYVDDDGEGCEASGANHVHDQIERRQVLKSFHSSCMSPKKVWLGIVDASVSLRN